MLEFLGLACKDGKSPYFRTPEGPWSWQHILQVSILMVLMVGLAIFFGKKYKDKSAKEKNKVLIVTAILINAVELFKIIVLCIRHEDPFHWRYVLPLFLCSIQLIAIPMAAFCKGRVREACLDFVLIFGILGAVFGTIGSVHTYTKFPVFSLDNVCSGVTHSMSGFASLYIAISGMVSLKKENVPITFCVLIGFAILAYVANIITGYNYMFLKYHDGTPYSIFYNLVGGSPILYPLIVVGIFVGYLLLYYNVYFSIKKKKETATKTQNS